MMGKRHSKMDGRRGGRRREYFPRISPLERYHVEEKFRRRYRLSKECVRQLAEDFGNSRFALQGYRSGGGLSHDERVITFCYCYCQIIIILLLINTESASNSIYFILLLMKIYLMVNISKYYFYTHDMLNLYKH